MRNKQPVEFKWYYQTSDYKVHQREDFDFFEELIHSREKLVQFMKDKITAGCINGPNFLEISLDEKTLRIDVCDEEKFIEFTTYEDFLSKYEESKQSLYARKKPSLKENLLHFRVFSAGLILCSIPVFRFFPGAAIIMFFLGFVASVVEDLLTGEVYLKYHKVAKRDDDNDAFFLCITIKIIFILILAVVLFIGLFEAYKALNSGEVK